MYIPASPFPKWLAHAPPLTTHSEVSCQWQVPNIFQAEQLHIHSQLLLESQFVSPPPPTYMLKFSGSLCLHSHQKCQHATAKRCPYHRRTEPAPKCTWPAKTAMHTSAHLHIHCGPHPPHFKLDTPFGLSQGCIRHSVVHKSRSTASQEPKHSLPMRCQSSTLSIPHTHHHHPPTSCARTW